MVRKRKYNSKSSDKKRGGRSKKVYSPKSRDSKFKSKARSKVLYPFNNDIKFSRNESDDFLVLINRYIYFLDFDKAVNKEVKSYKDFKFKISEKKELISQTILS